VRTLGRTVCRRWERCLASDAASIELWRLLYARKFPTLRPFLTLDRSGCDAHGPNSHGDPGALTTGTRSWRELARRRWRSDTAWLNESEAYKLLLRSWHTRDSLHVGPGREFASLAGALRCAGPFDRVLVHPGDYPPQMVCLNRPVEIIGVPDEASAAEDVGTAADGSRGAGGACERGRNPRPHGRGSSARRPPQVEPPRPVAIDVLITVRLQPHQTARVTNLRLRPVSSAAMPHDALAGVEPVSGVLQLDDCVLDRASLSLMSSTTARARAAEDGGGRPHVVGGPPAPRRRAGGVGWETGQVRASRCVLRGCSISSGDAGIERTKELLRRCVVERCFSDAEANPHGRNMWIG
jgi:hypothetical protein